MRLAEARQLIFGRDVVPVVLLALVVAAGALAPGVWSFIAVVAAIQGILALSAGMLYGQVGMLSLCQLTFAYIGVWVTAWLNVNTGLPFPLMVLGAGLAAVPAGLVVGGLAVRFRGVLLAITTFTFAGGMSSVLAQFSLPGLLDQITIKRPLGFGSDRWYFVLCVGVLVIIGRALAWYETRRGGLAWRAIKQSERATAAAGLSVAWGRLRAFCLSAFIAGIAGGLIAGQLQGSVSASSFTPVASIALIAAAVMVGADSLSGAVLAGILVAVVPEAFSRWGLNAAWGQILFGVGAVQALSGGVGGISATFPWRRLQPSTLPSPTWDPNRPILDTIDTRGSSDADAAVLVIENMTVRYGQVVALNNVSISVPTRTVMGVIGPNGAGKSTLIDTVCGYVPGYEGEVRLEGRSLRGQGAAERARRGLRRTFQQGRAIEALTVGSFIDLRLERPLSSEQRDQLLGFFALPAADHPVELVDVGTQRVLEVAAAVASRPAVAFLDEPLAGLGANESEALAARIREIPERFGCSVVLVEHDVEKVAASCSMITVLDFGAVIASGPPREVLADQVVIAAYLGGDLTPGMEVAS